MKTIYSEITLKKGREASLLRGHPWVFSGAISAVKGKPAAGDIVLACDARGKPLALGFYNHQTDIAFRLLTRDTNMEISAAFWQARLQAAIDLRRKIINKNTNAYRLINAEGDGFPGLIVDVYGAAIVISIATAGIEKQRNQLLATLISLLQPELIYEQSAGKSRKLEGMETSCGFLYGEKPNGLVEIKENGLLFAVDFIGGQKTGFFLDQRINREKIGALSRHARVLNCFSYTGAFSVYAATGRAKEVISIDISKSACAAAEDNLAMNNISPLANPVIATDVFNYLRETTESFDLIILDPPAFAKSKRDVDKAARGYKEINLQAMKRLPAGGILATFSCSNFMEEILFARIVQGAARDAGVEMKLLEKLQAGPDHPTAMGHQEGSYLKGLLLAKN